MDDQTTTQSNTAEFSALERRAQRLIGPISTVQGPLARIDWLHDAASYQVLSRVRIAEDD